jgi:ubiquinone/menaquinone biosynthesis C-methylase UbiE
MGAHSYDDYNYEEFWLGRDYEDRADKYAISKLISVIKGPFDKLIDIGAGMGRITPLYDSKYKTFVLFDPSKEQLRKAEKRLRFKDKAKTIVGYANHIPVADSEFDTAICIRMFHYVSDPNEVIKEVSRILKIGGYFILEIPNKIHLKNRILTLLGKRGVENSFVNHDPKVIKQLLSSNGFEVVETLSVSNFRFTILKKLFPTSFLFFVEKIVQKPLSRVFIGPSIYFLARRVDSKI